LRQETSLGAQMACTAIFSVCKAYRSQRALGRIPQDTPVPPLCFSRTGVHFDYRTYTLKGEALSLNTLQGRLRVPMILGDHQRQDPDERPAEGGGTGISSRRMVSQSRR